MRLRALLLRAALFVAAWWALSGGASDTWGVGLAAVALAVAVSLLLQPPNGQRFSIVRLPRFFAFFVLQSIKGGIQVAAMAFRPRLNLQPAVLKIDLRLPEQSAQVFLASTLSLLPGTLSTGLDGNRLHLHVLDRRLPVEQEVRNAESMVAHLFRMELG